MTQAQQIEAIIEEPLHHKGYRLVRVRSVGTKTKTLQIMIERLDDTPITVDDCATVSRMISVFFEVEDPIDDRYILEVSSTGLERPLVKLSDYERFCGKEVAFHLFQVVENRKKWNGTIMKVKDHQILFEVHDDLSQDTKQLEIEYDNIRSCHLVFILDKPKKPVGKNRKNN